MQNTTLTTLQSLDHIRQRLLDLSKRNQLLSYKEKARTVHIVNTTIIFHKLVSEGKSMTFAPLPKPLRNTTAINVSCETLPPPYLSQSKEKNKKAQETLLHTAHNEEVLERRCKKLAQDARMAIEETGSNLLYLALGFLHWYDDKLSTEPVKAPLILMPVKLERVHLPPTYEYVLSYRDEDIETNISLAEKLANDFNLVLPMFSHQTEPLDYLAQVAEMASEIPRWQVVPDIRLDFFSFTKLLMYKDLKNDSWAAKLADNANLKQILVGENQVMIPSLEKAIDAISHFEPGAVGKTSTKQEIPSFQKALKKEIYPIDCHPLAMKTPLILDADSSQQSVIMKALWEQSNLVIEGPPGTGKSQTITNLIAAALAQDKSVLFVAEKKAALEVVSSRLEKVGLGDFCLELHSHKTQKNVFHANIKKRLNKEYHDATLKSDSKTLTEQRLLAYSNLVNTTTGPNDERIYDLFWAVEKLRGDIAGEKLRFEVQNPFQTKNDFDNKINKLKELGEQYVALSDKVIQHWQGFKPTKIWPGDEEIIQGILSTLFLETQSYEAYLDVLIEETKIPLTKDLAALQLFTKINLAPIKPIPTPFDSAAAVQLLNRRTIDILRQFKINQKEYRQLLIRATQFLGHGRYSVKFLQQVLNETSQLEQLGFGNESPNEIMVLIKNVDKLDNELRSLLNNPESVENFLKFLQLRELAERAPQDLVINKHSAHALEATPIVFQHAHQNFAELVVQWDNQKEDFLLNKLPPSEDIAVLADELRKHRSKWLAFLSGDYRRTKRAMNRFLATSKLNTRQLIKRLETLATLKRQIEQATQRAQYKRLFGSLFQGIETDWALLEQHIEWAQALAKVLGSSEEAQELLATQANPRGHILKSTAVMYEQWLRVTKAAEQLQVPVDSHLLVNEFVEKLFERRKEVVQLVTLLQQQLPHLGDKHVISIHSAVQNLLAAWQLRSEAEQNLFLKKLFGKAYRGIETEATALFAMSEWITHLQTATKMPIPLLHWLVSKDTAMRLTIYHVLLNKNQSYLTNLMEHCQKLAEFGELNTQQWFRCPDKACTLAQITKTTRTCQASVNLLGTLSTFYVLKQELDEMGFQVITDAMMNKQIKPSSAPLHFQYAVYQNIARELVRKHDILAHFTRTSYENLRQRFAELDKKWQNVTRQHIAYQMAQKAIPKGNGTGRVATFTEKCLIEHELNKKRRHIPIRQLVRRATKALQAMKPCFMMGPLSVAQYLPPGQIEFDLLIMDEASQVRPEDALGAIARCKQIVIVGDPKQLPPTQFFERLVNEEEVTALDGQESILDLCLSTYQKGQLRWHYRSEHESLIAFSNHHFYDNELMIFPAPTLQQKGYGVHLNYVEQATYFRGCNQKEAEAVVAAIVSHFQNAQAFSLGVATFNMRQQALISEILDKRCQEDTWLEGQIKATENTPEPFFIKNLENVQGDERDIIFVSSTYGPDPETGKVFQRFGPISHEMGWRRLNVIFTRAKKRLELFTSMRSSNIHPKAKRGVQILKTYLEYAETGQLSHHGGITEPKTLSDFQQAVSKILQKQGYKTVSQVGVAGYRIDIGVLHPEKPDEYILGIECDGANYHQAKSLRDRDRLRQEILENKGWKIHRIWSIDWFKHREAEIIRLLKTLSEAKKGQKTEMVVQD